MLIQNQNNLKEFLLLRSRFINQKSYWVKKLTGKFDITTFKSEYDFQENISDSTYNLCQLNQKREKKEIAFPNELGKQLIKLSKNSDLLLYILLLTALKALIFRYTLNEDIIIISPLHKFRVTEETLNHLVFIRDQVKKHFTFRDMVKKVRQSVLDAYENQDYPYDKLIEILFVSSRNKKNDEKKNLISNVSEVFCAFENIHALANERDSFENSKARFSFIFSKKDNQLQGYLIYDSDILIENEAVQIGNHFLNLITKAIEDVNTKIGDILFISEQEKIKLLVDFNCNQADFCQEKSINHFITEKARDIPDIVSITYCDESITYLQLETNSDQFGGYLLTMGLKTDQPVRILLERSLRMMIVILGIWKAGGAYIPLDINTPKQRLIEVLKDSKLSLLIADSNNLDPQIENLIGLIDINLDEKTLPTILPIKSKFWNMKCLSYIIYTSGSTGRPKGVMVEHIGMMNHIYAKISDLQITRKSNIAQNASHTFDISVWQFFASTICGGRTIILQNEILLNPNQMILEICKHQITILEVVPSYLSIILEILPNRNQAFQSLKYLLVTGEKIKSGLVKQWFETYPSIQMVNAYGPTEASDDITHFFMNKSLERKRIPVGRPIQNLKIYILDDHMNLCPIGVKGEICVVGIGVGRGYLNNPEKTALAFFDDFFITNKNKKNRLYKTGDIGSWSNDGIINFFGRKDYQVKIRGFRIELGEIENHILSLNSVKEAVVIVRDSENGDKYLCAYVVAEVKLSVPILINKLSCKLPKYMVPSYFIQLEQIPLNINGKVNRKALPKPEMITMQNYTTPRNTVEYKLTELWAELLEIDKNNISIEDNFFYLGGHSLKATIMVARIHKEFNVKIPLVEVFKNPTIEKMALYLLKAEKERYFSIKPIEKKEYYDLSSAQKRLYILQQMDLKSVGYNMPLAIKSEGFLKSRKIEETFRKLIVRHESLRTSFKVINGRPVQRIHAALEDYCIEYYKIEINGDWHKDVTESLDMFVKPFVLSRIPLVRLILLMIEEHKHILFFDMHHIISDGISTSILVKDFTTLYGDKELPILRIQYKDFASWEFKKIETIKAQEQFWLENFSDIIPVLMLPTDYERPSVKSEQGSVISFQTNKEEYQALKSIAFEEGITIFMLLLACFYIFLSKLSSQEEIIVGTPVAGRRHTDLESIIGVFLNTLPVRIKLDFRLTVIEYVREIKKKTIDVFANQDFPYERLVERLKIERDASRNPLFDVMFVLQNVEMTELQMPDLKLSSYPYEVKTAKFDILLSAVEAEHYIYFTLSYCTELFKKDTIKRYVNCFKQIVSAVSADTRAKLGEIVIISREEKQEILHHFNDTTVSYPQEKLLHQLFEEQVEKSKDHIVLICRDRKMTYDELNKKTNQMARILQSKGILSETVTGILMERSLEMQIVILAILKAGATYLPLDPDYPNQRIFAMADTAGVSMIITTEEIFRTKSFNPQIFPKQIFLPVNKLFNKMLTVLGSNLEANTEPNHLIYIIFTSGSTGKPKGAGVYHRSFVNLMYWFIKEFKLNCVDNNLLLTSLSFDLTQKNFYASMLTGGILTIPGFNYFDPGAIINDIKNNCVTWINCTPSMFYMIVEFDEKSEVKKLSTLRYVFLGGESISISKIINWLELGDHEIDIINTYGPTECTDICSFYRIQQPRFFLESNIPVGKPIYNTHLYILDKYLQLLPLGIPGELVIGGVGVGIGYVNDENLTQQRFFKRSFGKGDQECLYRTGDLAKWLQDGNIELLGRIDRQVKIRGFRIELGEIESRLMANGHIKNSAVIIRSDPGRGQYLCAYIVPDAKMDIMSLREYLSNSLPEYMIPSLFVQVENIPLNSNGKVDIKALELLKPMSKNINTYVAPKNDIEKKITEIWKDVLNLDRIGVGDNYFDLGGTSFDIVKINEKLKEYFKKDIPIMMMFRFTTVKSFANYLINENFEIQNRSNSLKRGKQDKLKRLNRRRRV